MSVFRFVPSVHWEIQSESDFQKLENLNQIKFEKSVTCCAQVLKITISQQMVSRKMSKCDFTEIALT